MLPFSLAAGLTCPSHADLAASLAAEFRPLDEDRLDAGLDGLAIGLSHLRGEHPLDQLEALAGVMAAFEAIDAPLDPRAVHLDVALDRLMGPPTTLAVIAVETGRRAGFDVGVVGDGRRHLVAHRRHDGPGAFDPTVPAVCDVEECRIGWRCSHQLAFALLREHLDRALRVGDLAGALRAAELRLELPLEPHVLERLTVELWSLRSRLN